MKTYCKNYHIDRAHVQGAFESWCRSVSGRKNRWRVNAEHGSEAALVDEIASELRERNLSLRPIHRYKRREPCGGKERVIGVESVKQQVCDYVAVTALEPLLTAKTGYYQTSSVKGKGQLFAARAAKRWMRDSSYWAHLDIRKCYPSISGEVVMRILRKHVRSDDVLYVCETLLGTYDGGLEIGSYFSLRISQLVLSYGYHHVESLRKERRGKSRPLVSHQLWYADDIYLFGSDKRDLKSAARSLEAFLLSELGLSVKPWKVCRCDCEPVDVAGFVLRRERATLRAGIFLRARRAFRRFSAKGGLRLARRACSYWGWFKHTDSTRFVEKSGIKNILRDAMALVSSSGRGRTEAVCN